MSNSCLKLSGNEEKSENREKEGHRMNKAIIYFHKDSLQVNPQGTKTQGATEAVITSDDFMHHKTRAQ